MGLFHHGDADTRRHGERQDSEWNMGRDYEGTTVL